VAVLSGAAGLAYEVGWARAFALQLGAEVPVFTGMLAAFLGGLALGGWLGGRWSARAASPLRLFAWLEAGTGVAAVLVLPLLHAGTPLFSWLYRRHLDTGGSFLLPGVLLAAAAMLPATILMGATFPALVEHLRRRGKTAGGSAGVLYGANTAGAVAGALATGLLLLPTLGLAFTMALAAVANLTAAGLAVLLQRRATEGAAAPPTGTRAGVAGSSWLLGAVFLAGAASMVNQVGWTRALSLLLGSTVYGFSLILAAFLTGLALGGATGARLAREPGHGRRTLSILYGLMALSSLLALTVLGRLAVWLVPPLARAQADLSWVLALQFLAAFAVVVLPTFLMGAAFPLAVSLQAGVHRPAGLAAGEVYAVSSAGLVAGALLCGAWLLPALGLHGSLLASALGLSCCGLLVSRHAPGPGARRLAVSGAMLALLAGWTLPAWDPGLLTSGPFLYAPLYRAGAQAGDLSIVDAIHARGELLFHSDGGDATVSVRRSPAGVVSLQINGKTDGSTGGDMVSQLVAGHLPALLAPRSGGSALLVGLATGVSLGALETYPFRRIDVVELLPGVVEAAGYFQAVNSSAMQDERVHLQVGDARNHLRYSHGSYDVIASQPTNPWVAGSAALFTRETFLAARARLREDGIFCQWVQGYGMQPEDLRSVVATFLEVFPHSMLWEESPAGGDYFLVGYKTAPASLDLHLVESRMNEPATAADLARGGIQEPAELLARFVAGPDALHQWTAGSEVQQDDRTLLEFTAAAALYRNTLPALVRTLRRQRQSPVPWIARYGTPAEDLLPRLRAARTQARREERFLLSLSDAGAAALAHPELGVAAELLRAGLTAPAQVHLERAATSTAAGAEARALLGALLASTGDTRRARQELSQAVQLRPGDVASLALLARLCLEDGDLQEAGQHLALARSLHPGDPDLLNLAGALRLLEEEPADALRLLEAAVEGDPALAEAWSNLGVARRRLGQEDAALDAYRQALELDPIHADARFNLAVALWLRHDASGAMAELLRILEQDPSDASARLQLARIHRDEGRVDQARHQLQVILEELPGAPEAASARTLLNDL
jgi:spermidine synthase